MSTSSYDIERIEPGSTYPKIDELAWRDIQDRLVHIEKILSGKLNTLRIRLFE